MPNLCALIENHSVADTTLTYFINVIAADGATYGFTVEINGSVLIGNIQNINQSIKDAIEAKLNTDFGVVVGAGNKIVLMGGGV